MKYFIKHKVIFLVITAIFITQISFANQILPVPKPPVDKETKELTEKRKEAGAVIETAVMTPISDEHLANYPDAYIKN